MSKVAKLYIVKIGIFDPYLDTLGGGEKYMLTAAVCLSKFHDVSLFWDDKSIIKDVAKRFSIDLSNISFSKNIFSPKISLWEKVIESMKYDRIFFLSDGSIPVVFPKKLLIHFQFPVEWVSGKSFPNRLKIGHVSKIICNSQFTKKYIDKAFGVKSEVLYPPSSGEFKIVKNVEKENIILTVGRLSVLSDNTTFKKQEFMIDSFKELCDKRFKNWKLVLVISYRKDQIEYFEKLKKMTQGYNILIEENVAAEKLVSLYQKSKIYWHAAGFGENIQKHPEMAEHFGIATVQAMEQGAVPVVIDQGGQREIVTDKIDGFLWKTKSELLDKTKSLMINSSLQKKISANTIQRADYFSREKFCKELMELFK